MLSRSNFLVLPALVGIGLFAFVDSVSGQQAVGRSLQPKSEADLDDSDDDNDESRRARATRGAAPRYVPGQYAVDADGERQPADDIPSYTFAQVTSTSGATASPTPGAEHIAESERIVVRGFDVNPVEYPALPEVEGTRINSGKKTSFVKPEEFPTIANNNYRELMSTTPGILVSEEPSSPIVNFGYRGLDSQRSEFMQVLKDGVSIKNEQFGFPESHYTPILDSVERVEFIRAGAALQFGPQPGGALNFVTKMPRHDAPFQFTTKNLYGSDELFTSYTAIEGTSGPFGYYGYYDHREREGFREANSDYEVNAGSLKLVFDAGNDSRFVLTLDGYEEEHGEPGGLRRHEPGVADPPGSVLYEDDRDATSRFFDRFRLKRYYAVLDYQKLFSEHTQLDIKAFGGYLSRFSKRQRGGDLGIMPDPNPAPGSAASTNDIQLREDWIEGAELRLRHDYSLANDTSTIAGGLYFYHALQDRSDERGATPDAESGLLRRFNTGETYDGAVFVENRFHFGRLSITPGMRLEFIQQSLDEIVNITKPIPPETLLTRSDFSFVPLFALGASYVVLEAQQAVATTALARGGKGPDGKEMQSMVQSTAVAGGPPRVELYGTVSQAYRPRTYGELVPTSAGGTVNGDLEEGHSLQFELGVRGKPLPYLSFDGGGFYYTFDDQIGEVGTTTQNVGDARFAGFEAAAELDILAMINGGAESPCGRFNLYGNITWLDAEFTAGPANGNRPAYAPEYQFKAGGIYRWKDIAKVGLIGTIVDDHFSNADNGFQHFIPAYAVWDLTAEVNVWHDRVGVFGGINNLFDEDFYAEIRDEGIVPAAGRNFYGGVKISF